MASRMWDPSFAYVPVNGSSTPTFTGATPPMANVGITLDTAVTATAVDVVLTNSRRVMFF